MDCNDPRLLSRHLTTIAGAAQGLVVTPPGPGFLSIALIAAEAMLLIGLIASFGHLAGPDRAWRAVLMWRREPALGTGLTARVRGAGARPPRPAGRAFSSSRRHHFRRIESLLPGCCLKPES